jgi:RNA polymerase sigma-70 factor (ECF subfamily)
MRRKMTESAPSADFQLMQRICAQDKQALAELYDRYGALVHGLSVRVLNDDGRLAQEVTQDTFLKIWHQADQWDPNRGKLTTWMLTIARRTAIDLLRKEQRRPEISPAEFDDVLSVVGQGSLVDDPRWHDGRLIRQLLQQLPDEQRQAIELAFYYDMSHTEVAERLDLPLGTVKTRIRLGLQKLKALWSEAVTTGDE